MSRRNAERKPSSGLRKYISYGSGFLADACYYQFVSAYLLVFLTGPAGMSSKDAGTVASFIVLADAVFSLFVGRFTDGLKCRYGRRRPILLFCAGALPLTFCLSFLAIGGSAGTKLAYYMTVGFLYYALYILYYISQTALGADISDGYDDSIKMNSISSLITNVGSLVCLSLPLPAIGWMQRRGMSPAAAWFTFAVLMSAAVVAGMLACWNDSRGREKMSASGQVSQSVSDMLHDYRLLLSLKPYRRLIETKFILNFCFTMYSNSMVFFIAFRLPGDPELITSLAYTFNTVLSFAVIPALSAFALRFGKKWTTVVTAVFYGASGLTLYFLGITGTTGLLVYVFAHAIGVHGFWQLYTTNLYDIADLDEYRNNVRREGNIVGLQSFICTLGISLTVRIMTLLLDGAGFDGGAAVQSPEALRMLDTVFILLPGIASLAGALVMYSYRVSREGLRLTREAVSRRKSGDRPLADEEIVKIEAMFR